MRPADQLTTWDVTTTVPSPALQAVLVLDDWLGQKHEIVPTEAEAPAAEPAVVETTAAPAAPAAGEPPERQAGGWGVGPPRSACC